MVFQGDQPFITPAVINSLISSFTSSHKGIVIPVYKKKRGHPLLFSNKYFKDVEMLDLSEGLRGLARRFPEDVLEVDSPEPGILRDFDTYDDYLEEINKNTKL
jgi:molybdenum cofactor cytidylyltransferase